MSRCILICLAMAFSASVNAALDAKKLLVGAGCGDVISLDLKQEISQKGESASEKTLVCGTTQAYLEQISSPGDKFYLAEGVINLSSTLNHTNAIDVDHIKDAIEEVVTLEANALSGIKNLLKIQDHGKLFFAGFQSKQDNLYFVGAIASENRYSWLNMDLGRTQGRGTKLSVNSQFISNGSRISIENSGGLPKVELIIEGISIFSEQVEFADLSKVIKSLLDLKEIADTYLSGKTLLKLTDKSISIDKADMEDNKSQARDNTTTQPLPKFSGIVVAENLRAAMAACASAEVYNHTPFRPTGMVNLRDQPNGQVIKTLSPNNLIYKAYSAYYLKRRNEANYIQFGKYHCVFWDSSNQGMIRGWMHSDYLTQ